jgi:iron complex outermembrane recepter protein
MTRRGVLAMSALSGDELEKKGVRDQTDLQFVTPSLSMTQVGFTENVNIRGIGKLFRLRRHWC